MEVPSMDETAWLVELRGMGSPQWARLRLGDWVWTDDASKALRFSRRQDAEEICGIFEELDVIATEHMWCSPASGGADHG
jgi:hypothetical protein